MIPLVSTVRQCFLITPRSQYYVRCKCKISYETILILLKDVDTSDKEYTTHSPSQEPTYRTFSRHALIISGGLPTENLMLLVRCNSEPAFLRSSSIISNAKNLCLAAADEVYYCSLFFMLRPVVVARSWRLRIAQVFLVVLLNLPVG